MLRRISRCLRNCIPLRRRLAQQNHHAPADFERVVPQSVTPILTPIRRDRAEHHETSSMAFRANPSLAHVERHPETRAVE
ncbi:MAG: hypothetical protein H0X31_17220 [Nostocaceae cyanobacterium]|nr:hypothetical protein [Nostocaceae cyanobacterium]